MNALVIKASSLYILKQMPHVSICFRFSSLCLWKEKTKFWTIESIVSPHNSEDLACNYSLFLILKTQRFSGSIVHSSAKRTNERDEAVAIRRGEKMQEVRHVKKMDGLGAQRG